MPITANDEKEFLSVAYLTAVAARAGYAIERPPWDNHGIDAIVREPHSPKRTIDVQLKCTSSIEPGESEAIQYPLKVKNYNDLRDSNAFSTQLLMLLVVPPSVDQVLRIRERAMVLRRCAYFLDLRGFPPTTNSNTVTVNIPRANLLSPENLRALMMASGRIWPRT